MFQWHYPQYKDQCLLSRAKAEGISRHHFQVINEQCLLKGKDKALLDDKAKDDEHRPYQLYSQMESGQTKGLIHIFHCSGPGAVFT